MRSAGFWLDADAAQVVTDFFDELKSRSKGYASMEYSITGYRANDLVRLDVKINNEVRLHIAHLTSHLTSHISHLVPPLQAASIAGKQFQ